MKHRFFFMFVAILLVVQLACTTGSNPAQPQNDADLWILSGPNAAQALGNGTDGGPLNKWADTNNINLYVQILDGNEAKRVKDMTLSGQNGPDAFIFDDGLYADGLKNSLSLAQSHTVLWIEDQAATTMGLPHGTNTITMDTYVDLLNSGQLSLTAGNATSSSPSMEHFFGILTWCSQQNTANLTMEMINDTSIKDCGKSVYDHIKTSASTTDAINLVYDGIVNNQANAYNSVIAFDSAFLGENGKNNAMINEANTYMRAFYFVEATPVSVVTFGTKDLTNDQTKGDLLRSLGDYLVGDEGQQAFNYAGLGNGASSSSFPDESAFNADWGVTMYPSQHANVINPPVPSVAFNAVTIYAQYYKRAKEVHFCIDTSGSTENADDGITPRLQSIDNAIVTVTDPGWQTANGIIIGNNDRLTYRFFATSVTPIITESTGPDTKPAGDFINALIGPATGSYNFRGNEAKVREIYEWYEFGYTAMFGCAEKVRSEIELSYDPNKDYYIVILTDGESYMDTHTFGQFKDNWTTAGHKNISLYGIQFGAAGNDVSQKNVSQINGKHYDGNNAEDLIQSFKDIFTN